MDTTSLAINGGQPVRSTLLPYGRQWIDDDDISLVNDVLRSDWLTTGPAVGEFERLFAAAVNTREAVAVSSGTAALHAVMFGLCRARNLPRRRPIHARTGLLEEQGEKSVSSCNTSRLEASYPT